MTKNPETRFAKSIVDYIFRWMAVKSLSTEARYQVRVNVREPAMTTPEQLTLDVQALADGAAKATAATPAKKTTFAAIQNQGDAPAVLNLWLYHGAPGRPLQVLELRHDISLCVVGLPGLRLAGTGVGSGFLGLGLPALSLSKGRRQPDGTWAHSVSR